MADRDEILINFQAMTGLEDLAMCIDILEQKEWDLTSAVNSMMSQPQFPSQPPVSSSPRSLGFIDLTQTSSEVIVPDRTHPYIDSYASAESAIGGALIELTVYYGARIIRLFLSSSTTVAQMKEQLEWKTGVQPYRQILKGWPRIQPTTDQDTLELLGLSVEASYTLTLEHLPHNLPAPPLSYEHINTLAGSLAETIAHVSTSLQETRSGASSLMVGNQLTDRMMMDPPQSRVVPVQEQSGSTSPVVSIASSSSHYSDAQEPLSSGEEDDPVLESLDDGLFDDLTDNGASSAMREPLIPQGCLEPYEALQFFTHAFEARYGAMHPLFLIGSLSEAVGEATSGSALSGSRKPMFIYLHHDSSILSNIFCSQLLCSESVVNYLTSNYVCWAWDLTLLQSKIKLLQMVEECFGKVAKSSVDEIRADHLPAMLIVYKVKGITDIKNIIQGETNIDSLMTSLMSAVDDHNRHIEMEAMEERERVQRGYMIADQNRAYEESLIADKQKARQREEEELAKVKQERLEEKERTDKEEAREAMEVCVPDEPSPDTSESVCTLRLRYPDGSQITRRFLATHQLQDLLNLLGSQGYLMSDHKLITSFPRRDISEMNPTESLEQCRLCPQETLFIEEK